MSAIATIKNCAARSTSYIEPDVKRDTKVTSPSDKLRERIRNHLDREERRFMEKALRGEVVTGLDRHYAEIANERAKFIDAPEFLPVLEAFIGQKDLLGRAAAIIRFLTWINNQQNLMSDHDPDIATRKNRGRKKVNPFQLNLPGWRLDPKLPRHTPHIWAAWIDREMVGSRGGSGRGTRKPSESRWRAIIVVCMDQLLPDSLISQRAARIAALLRLTGDTSLTSNQVGSILNQRGRSSSTNNDQDPRLPIFDLLGRTGAKNKPA